MFLNDEKLSIKELNLSSNYIKDINPLLKLEKLEFVNLKDQIVYISEKEMNDISFVIKQIKKNVLKIKENF